MNMNKYNRRSEYEADEYEEYAVYPEEDYEPEYYEYEEMSSSNYLCNPEANWDDDDFEITIPKMTVPKIFKALPKPVTTSLSISVEVEVEPEVPEKSEKPEVDLTKFLNWGKPKQPEPKVEKPESDVELTQFLNWGQSKLSIPEPTPEPVVDLEFPSLEDASKKPANSPRFNMGGRVRFTQKLDLAEVERECLDIVKQELEIVTIKVPNLYLHKRKAREYCESAVGGHTCHRDDCRAAHSLEDYLPRRCTLSTLACKEKKKVEECKLKHDDETFEAFLLRIKVINSSMFKKLNQVREQNRLSFKEGISQHKNKPSEKKECKIEVPVYEYVPSNRSFSSYLDAFNFDRPESKNEYPIFEEVKEEEIEEVKEEKEPEVWTTVEKKKKEKVKDVRTQAIETFSNSEKIGMTLSKTKLCLHWQKNGKCPRGDQCGFAHGKEELKVATCIFGVKCKKPDCKFAHPGESDKRSEAFEVLSNTEKIGQKLAKTKLCLHWEKNRKCPKGKFCGFAHGKEELQVAKCIFADKCRKPDCHFSH